MRTEAISPLLREQVARLEGWPSAKPGAICPTGFPVLDQALPWRGLPRGALHEIAGTETALGAATGFALSILARALTIAPARLLLWASCRDDLFPPGLVAAGIDPGRLIFAHCRNGNEVLFAVEEALRCPGLAATVGEIGEIDFVASRRLQLAAAAGENILLLLRPERALSASSAAMTRWRIASVPGGWSVELLRCRGGVAGQWRLERNFP